MDSTLLSETRIGQKVIRNRLVFSAPSPLYGGMDEEANRPTEALALYWGQVARGGVGLIVGEHQSVHPTSTLNPRVVENASDEIIQHYRRVTEAVHGQGAAVFGHLWHAGLRGMPGYRSLPLWGPSAVRLPPGVPIPAGGGAIGYAMRTSDIAGIVAAFGAAALRLREAGFDGVEVNAASGYLLAEFLSPKTNRRTDEYGGSLENRCRFVVEALKAVRAAAGRDMAVGVRISPDPYVEPGVREDDLPAIAALLSGACEIDYFSLQPGLVPDAAVPQATGLGMAQAVRAAAGVPVIFGGLITDPDRAESLVRDDGIDLLDMTRPLLADPDLPSKLRAGQRDAIRICIACNQTCTDAGAGFGGAVPRCILNPAAGLPGMAAPAPAVAAQRGGEGRTLLVVGAGLAGLEVARLARLRGMRVSVWEREAEIGGQVRLAARAPQRASLGEAIAFYARQVGDWGIDLRLGLTATPEAIDAFGPDVVVIATGALPARPEWLRARDGDPAVVAGVREVLAGDVRVGKRVIIATSETETGHQALPAAEFLVDEGHEVTVVSPAFEPAMHQDFYTGEHFYRRALRKGVRLRTCWEVIAVSGGEALARNKYSLQEERLPADTVVAAYGGVADEGLYFAVSARRPHVYRAGDCYAPRDMAAAMADASRVMERIARQG